VNGSAARTSRKLEAGDRVQVDLPPDTEASLVAEPIPLNIVYEDDDVIVIDKPAGLTAHPAPGHTRHTLANALLAHHPGLAGVGEAMRPGIVHRLDKDTSGLTIVAKSSSAQQYLIGQFKARSVTRGYLVLVKGKVKPGKGVIEGPIGRDPSNRKRMAVVADGKWARTEYSVKRYCGGYTLLEVTPETGRTHQIRVHLLAIGYPVAGDPVYGAGSPHLQRQFVHAYRLGFRLPGGGEYREFTSELPADLKLALERLCPEAAEF